MDERRRKSLYQEAFALLQRANFLLMAAEIRHKQREAENAQVQCNRTSNTNRDQRA